MKKPKGGKNGIINSYIYISIYSIYSNTICCNANQMLDKLYHFAKQYQKMSPQEQVIYLSEAEKIFTAFDKVPVELWDEEYEKYKQVLKKYNDIKMFRWASN